ncbi:MAG: SIS domain-containing protein [Anaerolineaceae bacterium]|nr:SIS domain-containing protein [Anaerolineaceae bacterium]
MEQNKDHYRTQHPYHVWDSLQLIPALMSDCLEGEVQSDIQKVVKDFQARGINKIIMLGRGSSYFAALAVESLFEKLTKIPVSCYVTNVFQEYPYEGCDSKTAAFFISHSGKSEGDLRVVEQVKALGGYSIGVTDIAESPLAEAVDQLLIGPGGSKIELPASRTYATAIYRLQLLAQALAEVLQVVDDPDEYKDALLALPEQVKEFMAAFETEAPKVVDLLSDRRYQMIIGFGPNWANAGEAAMAFNQSSGIPTLRYEMENYIHGPMQGLTADAGVIGIAPTAALQNRLFGMMAAARTIGAKTVLLAPKGTQAPAVDYLVELPAGIPDLISAVPYMVPLWQIGYHFGLLGNGTHPDRLSMDKPEFKEAFSYIMKEDKWVTKK